MKYHSPGLLASLLLHSAVLPDEPVVHMGIPPEHLYINRSGGKIVATDRVRAHVKHDTEGRALTITWRMFQNSGYPATESPIQIAADVHALSFWPTCTAALGEDRLAVAGKKRNGETILEVWEVAPPLHGFGLDGPILSPQPIVSKEVVLEEAEPSRDMIRGIFPNLAAEGVLFVQYDSSRDLYSVNWADPVPSQALVWSAQQQPLLLEDWDMVSWGEHSALGSVALLSSGGLEILVIQDADVNGDLDSIETKTPALREALENSGHWTSYWNVPMP